MANGEHGREFREEDGDHAAPRSKSALPAISRVFGLFCLDVRTNIQQMAKNSDKRNFTNTERPSPDCAFGSPERGANGKLDVEGLSSLEQFSGALVPGLYFQDLLVEIPCIVCSPHDLTNLADMQKCFGIAGVLAEDVDKDP